MVLDKPVFVIVCVVMDLPSSSNVRLNRIRWSARPRRGTRDDIEPREFEHTLDISVPQKQRAIADLYNLQFPMLRRGWPRKLFRVYPMNRLVPRSPMLHL